jgi:tetratricopeptide (TPR) repeat protein
VTEDIEKNDVDRKKALVKLNKISNQLGTKRDGLASTERMKKQLQQLKNIQRGPADRIAAALKNGDLKKALEAMERLQKQLGRNDLSDEQKAALAKQLEQLRDQLQEMLAAKDALEQQKRDIQKRIDDLKRQGDLASANKLQSKLDQAQEAIDALNKQSPQLQKLQELADQLGECSECLQKGDASEAAQQMSQMARMLRDMKDEMDQLETLDAIMDQIAEAKNSMNCQSCNGSGCEACMGAQMAMQGTGAAEGQPGMGMGEGTGMGDRPEEEEKTGGYRTRVSAKPEAGESVRLGDAIGPNVPGASQQAVKDEITSSFTEEADPVINRNLPRREREQAKEYFENYRKGRQ